MKPISEEIVEETWQEVASFTPGRADKEMTQLGEGQPDLLGFILEMTKDLDPEVYELAVYMFFNVYRMFQNTFYKKIKPISHTKIIKCYESNEKFLESLEGAHDKFFERIARMQISDQPYVMKYILETLIEAHEEEDPVELSDEDIGFLFLIFKTLIDVLNKVTD